MYNYNKHVSLQQTCIIKYKITIHIYVQVLYKYNMYMLVFTVIIEQDISLLFSHYHSEHRYEKINWWFNFNIYL